MVVAKGGVDVLATGVGDEVGITVGCVEEEVVGDACVLVVAIVLDEELEEVA